MNWRWLVGLCVLPMFFGAGSVQASENKAIQACEDTISSVYDVRKFRNVFAERYGKHKYRVYGKVKARGDTYPFKCKVKRGNVRSYSYDGPHGERHNNSKTNLAIGVGLAALATAAIISSQKESDDRSSYDHGWDTGKPIDNDYLEDECHDALARRVREEHGGVSRIKFSSDKIKHHARKLKGRGHIRWDYGQPSDFEFSCHFDRSGRVTDSSYSYY